jgi:hypothetical protein
MTQVRIEPWESSEANWDHNRFAVGDGAVNEHPLGTICHISPISPEDDRVVDDPLQSSGLTDFGGLRRRLLEVADSGDEEDTAKPDGDDEIT